MPSLRAFFTKEQNLLYVKECVFRLERFEFGEGSPLATMLPVISSMQNEADAWDKYTQYSITKYGDALRTSLSNVSVQPELGNIEVLAGFAFIFASELELSSPNPIGEELVLFKESISREFESRTDRAGATVKFGMRQLPISIFKDLLNSDFAGNLKQMDSTAVEVDKKVKGWEQSLKNSEEKVTQLQQRLEQQGYGYNFMGLSQGFDEMAKVITKELVSQRLYLKIFGFLMLLPALVDVALIASGRVDLNIIPTFVAGAWAALSITTTVVFLYFFRILLRDIDAKNAQLMQLRLRMTLCQFIQKYANYAKDIRKEGGDVLGKFENIIFSGIVANHDKLPSTFDGIEQLTSLIKTAKGG